MDPLRQRAAHGQDRPGAPEWPPGADGAISTESGWFSAPTREGQLKLPVGPSLATWPGNLVPYGTSPVLAMDPIVMVYNTNLVKTLMTGHRDTLRPELPGKVGSLDILSSTVVAFYTTLEKTYASTFSASWKHRSRASTTVPRAHPGPLPPTWSAGVLPDRYLSGPFPMLKRPG